MAKHHKRKKHHAVKRRRHAKVSGLDLTTVLSAVAGGIGANALNKIIPSTINSKVIAGAKIAVGLLAPMVIKNPSAKNIAAGLGTGFVVVGTLDLLKGFGVLNGIGEDDTLRIELAGNEEIMAGNDISVINGQDDLNVVNGTNEFDQV
jgi:hypothetical protein